MTGLDLFAILVLVVLGITIAAIWVVLCLLPGKIAGKRGHPQAEAVKVCGWLGGMTGGLLWPAAFIWAYLRSPPALIPAQETGHAGARSLGALTEKVSALEERLSALEKKGGGES